jgi:hypothetical protein
MPQVDAFEAVGAWGLEMPLSTCWVLYAVRARTIEPTAEWATGRASSVEFMGFNLKSLVHPEGYGRRIVLYQHDCERPSNPRGLLLAYEEVTPHRQVKPVVSDLDAFLVGARGTQHFEPLPAEQVELLTGLDSTRLDLLIPATRPPASSRRALRRTPPAHVGGRLTAGPRVEQSMRGRGAEHEGGASGRGRGRATHSAVRR